MDLSLDDVIKQQRSKNKKTGAGVGAAKKLKKLGARSGIVRKPNQRQATTQNNSNNNSSQQKKEPTTLHVSNLDFGVSNADIRELFAECGFIKKAAVHYDKSGRSLGTAEVVFASRDSAVRAIQKYNKVPLDGRPLALALVPSASAPIRSPQKSGRLGPKPGGGVVKRTSTRNGTVGAKGRAQTKGKGTFQRNQRQPKKTVTAEQLDADLEAYTRNA